MKIQTGPQPNAPKKLPRPQPGQQPQKPDPPPDKLDLAFKAGMLGVGSYVAGTAFPSTYLHELGHKMAINTLYQNAHPTITVNPFKGGATSWRPTGLSPLGEKLGATASRSTVAMAGTAMDALSSVALFATGYKLKKRNPVLGTSMMCYSAMTMLNSTAYAASGIGKTVASQPGHDFLTLQSMSGIPCWASAVIVASILPATYLVMRAMDHKIASE